MNSQCFKQRQQESLGVKTVLARFPEVSHARIFGSRATSGRARRASDIDLVTEAPGLAPICWHALLEALEQAAVIYKLDIVRLDTLQAPGLQAAIRQDRLLLWPKQYIAARHCCRVIDGWQGMGNCVSSARDGQIRRQTPRHTRRLN